MKGDSGVLNELLVEGLDDFHGLWWLLGKYSELPSAPDRKARTLALTRHLLVSGLFEAGFPAPSGATFIPWRLPPEAAFQRIASEWEALGHEPNIGDIVWFNLTAAGEAAARALVRPRA